MLITAVCEVCGKREGECIGGRCFVFKAPVPSAGGYCGLHNYGFIGVHCPHCVGDGK